MTSERHVICSSGRRSSIVTVTRGSLPGRAFGLIGLGSDDAGRQPTDT
jgi:hypothetical protein